MYSGILQLISFFLQVQIPTRKFVRIKHARMACVTMDMTTAIPWTVKPYNINIHVSVQKGSAVLIVLPL